MIRRYRFHVLPVLVPLAAAVLLGAAAPAPAPAQTDLNWAELTSACGSFAVELTAELDIVTELPAAWIGWVVTRVALGVCEPVTVVHGPVPFPDGARTYQFTDPSAETSRAYAYRLMAVDAAGNRSYVGSGGNFPPGYYQSAYATCEDAIAFRGRLLGSDLMPSTEPCEDQCWPLLSFVSGLPEVLQPLVGTSAIVELRGPLDDEFEGTYLAEVTGWNVLADCGTVPEAGRSWSALKAGYR